MTMLHSPKPLSKSNGCKAFIIVNAMLFCMGLFVWYYATNDRLVVLAIVAGIIMFVNLIRWIMMRIHARYGPQRMWQIIQVLIWTSIVLQAILFVANHLIRR